MDYLGIDIGTTSICAALYRTESGETLAVKTTPNRTDLPADEPFARMQDPDAIVAQVRTLLGAFPQPVAAVGLSGQMHGILYTDARGSAVSPLYTWQDGRGAQPYADGKTYAETLGCAPGYGLATDLYNEKNGRIPKSAARMCTVGDYAAMRLCGLREPLTHITNAASLGCFDPVQNRFTVKNARLPRVTARFGFAGKTDSGTPVAVCAGDNQASFIGAVPSRDAVLINIGTGAQISYLTGRPAAAAAEIRPFDGASYLAAGCALCGGRAFAAFERFCREIALAAGAQTDSFYPVLDRLLAEDFSPTLRADCRLSDTRADPSITGGFSNLKEDNFNLKEFAFAVTDGIIRELYELYDGAPDPQIILSGNGARSNPAVPGCVRRYFGSEPAFAPGKEEAAVGAALIAATAAGEFQNIDAAIDARHNSVSEGKT